MQPEYTKSNIQRNRNCIMAIAIIILISTPLIGIFQPASIYAMTGQCGSYSMWVDVTAMGSDNSWDHTNPDVACIVGTSCIEASYVCPEYDYRVRTYVTGPGSCYATDGARDSFCAIVDVYAPLNGAAGTYDVDNYNYRVLNVSGGEEYLGCTHTFIDAGDASELYYYFDHSYEFSGPDNRPKRACIYNNCPGNEGKPCYSSAGFTDYREASASCPKGILLVSQRVRKFLGIEQCKIIDHHDFAVFSCP